jgi:hypothetical protein
MSARVAIFCLIIKFVFFLQLLKNQLSCVPDGVDALTNLEILHVYVFLFAHRQRRAE